MKIPPPSDGECVGCAGMSSGRPGRHQEGGNHSSGQGPAVALRPRASANGQRCRPAAGRRRAPHLGRQGTMPLCSSMVLRVVISGITACSFFLDSLLESVIPCHAIVTRCISCAQPDTEREAQQTLAGTGEAAAGDAMRGAVCIAGAGKPGAAAAPQLLPLPARRPLLRSAPAPARALPRPLPGRHRPLCLASCPHQGVRPASPP